MPFKDMDPAIHPCTAYATPGLGGFINPSGTVLVSSAQPKTFHISAPTGYSIADVIVDSISEEAAMRFTGTTASCPMHSMTMERSS